MSITGRTKTGDIKLPEPPEPARAGELTDERLLPHRLEAVARDMRELIGVLKEQVLPMIDRIVDRIVLLEQDRNDLYIRVATIEAKLAKLG